MPRGVSNTLDYMHVELLYYIEMAALYQLVTFPLFVDVSHLLRANKNTENPS